MPQERTLRILLVEDHVATASALAKTLLRQGFAVAPANSAGAALAAARLQPFDLLITDIGLPQKNGWELFRELRRLQPNLMAIAVTGYSYPQDIERSKEVGIQVHLTKPATAQQILAAIGQLFPKPPNDEPPPPAPRADADRKTPADALRLLYLEDNIHDVELLELACRRHDADCELTAAMSREAFLAALCSDRFHGILSDSGVYDLAGVDAVKLARSLAPGLPYVFICGTMSPAKHTDLKAARPDGIFSKDRPEDAGLAIELVRKIREKRNAPRKPEPA